ncbi:MAG: TrmB family transcriptional regulator [Halorhabdus sp.]
MNDMDPLEAAVDILQQLGLKEYEARCFVGLMRLETGTAKRLSELTDVPRTRVYDAVRVLEAQGLVEVQHSSPQRFRAVSLDVAVETLRDRYERRVERLAGTLASVENADEDCRDPPQQVWALSGREAIETRSAELVESADDEVVLVIGDESAATTTFLDALSRVGEDVSVIVGTVTPTIREQITSTVPRAQTFISGLEWLQGDSETDDTAIGRLLLVDRSALLVSSVIPKTNEEQAVFSEGFDNGIVVIARRIMSQGLLPPQ